MRELTSIRVDTHEPAVLSIRNSWYRAKNHRVAEFPKHRAWIRTHDLHSVDAWKSRRTWTGGFKEELALLRP